MQNYNSEWNQALVIIIAIGVILGVVVMKKIQQEYLSKLPIIGKVINFFRSSKVPVWAKLVGLFASVAYFILPIDIVPDILGIFFGAGYLDDLTVIYLIISLLASFTETTHKPTAPSN
jgi:uncharacterized membrane protein YkvA (DUF1232 family)